jgi:hypothetical protein
MTRQIGRGCCPTPPSEYVINELTTLWEQDWTAIGNVVLADGPVNIAGKTWTQANTAAATVADVTAGQGLRITAASGVSRTWTSSAVTSPALRINLSDLTPINWTKDLWIWQRFTTRTTPVSANAVYFGVYAAATGAFTATITASGWSHNGAAQFPSQLKNTTLTAQAAYPVTGPPGDGLVLVHRLTQDGSCNTYGGAWNGGWPDPSALTLLVRDVSCESATIVTLGTFARANAQLLITAATRAITGSPALVLANSRIQQPTPYLTLIP